MKNAYSGIPPRDALDIVFANRNRAYGAYALRRAYSDHLLRALAMGLLLIAAALVFPYFLKALATAFPAEIEKETTIVLDRNIAVETPPPPPPVLPPTPPRPPRATIAFKPPVVVKDDRVTETPPPVDEIFTDEREVGGITQRGESGPPQLPDVLPAPIPEAPKEDETEYPIYGVQKPPTFPGGEQAMFRFIQENLKYPALARENNITGRAAISFVVNKDGSISDVSILKDPGAGTGKEAARIVAMMPNWLPGEANGHAVKVRYTLPVQFKLE